MEEMIYGKDSKCEILHRGQYKGYSFLILSYGTHPCAYVRVPKHHRFYQKHYDAIDINCHGGLTYAGTSVIGKTPVSMILIEQDGWWIGWDYAHCNDYAGYYKLLPEHMQANHTKDKKWTTQEIYEEVMNVIDQTRQGFFTRIFKKIIGKLKLTF